MPLSPVTRRRLAMQGVSSLDNPGVAAATPWLRLAPGICAAWGLAGTELQSAALIAALVPIAGLGAARSKHPFDAIYDYGIRRLTGTQPIPAYGAPRRFACALAAVWLAVTSLALASGAAALGTALGIAFVVTATVPALTDFCIPSYLYGRLGGLASSARAADPLATAFGDLARELAPSPRRAAAGARQGRNVEPDSRRAA